MSFADRVAAASAEWIFIPEDAPHVIADDFTAVCYPPTWGLPTQINGINSDDAPTRLIERVNEVVRGWQRPDAAWWVSDATRPTGLEDALRSNGARLVETVAVLAYDLRAGVPDVGDTSTSSARIVSTADDITQWGTVNARAWGQAEPDEDTIARAWRQLSEPSQTRVIGYREGRPVSVGGLTLKEDVARLWGGATVPGERRGGAYRAGLLERLRIAHEAGATVALVKGRIETSAPILTRIGFTAYGEQRAYALDASAPVGS